jgi:hypothetical protein
MRRFRDLLCRIHDLLAVCVCSSMLRFEWDEKKIGAIGENMEGGLKKLRAPSEMRIRASSMIQNTQTTRIGLSSSERVLREDLWSSFIARRNLIQ